MFKALCCCLLLASNPAWGAADSAANVPPSADDIIHRIAARDKILVQHRRVYDYDIAITREKLDEDKKVLSTATEHAVVPGDKSPSYGTRTESSDPEQEAQSTSREEPFELLKIIDHYTYTLEGTETVNGVECYRIAFTPKPDLPYDNREEKVLNHVSGHMWASTQDYSLIRNEGSLMEPVSVAWIFATLHEMQFHFDAMKMPNGEYGPGFLQYRYLVHIPFTQLHERDSRKMSNYRLHDAAIDGRNHSQ
jgi:hypothetical protein